jgi:hypothetical protein
MIPFPLFFLLLVGLDWGPRYLLKSLGTAATLAYFFIIIIGGAVLSP